VLQTGYSLPKFKVTNQREIEINSEDFYSANMDV